jgi:phage terminase large subunit-like protein
MSRWHQAILERGPELARLSDEALLALKYDWELFKLPHQEPPDWTAEDVSTWMQIGGRGSAKSTAAIQEIRRMVDAGVRTFGFVGPDAKHVREAMIAGKGGLLDAFPPHQRPQHISSRSTVVFHTGAIATTFTADRPQSLRGKNIEVWWVDEPGNYRDFEEVWRQVALSARVGNPRKLITSNPPPPGSSCDLLERLTTEAKERRIKVTWSTSFDNFNNLPRDTQIEIEAIARTSAGQGEVYGRFWKPEGALWKREDIRYRPAPTGSRTRTVVAVDPTGTVTGDECGIVVATRVGGCAYILDDLSGHFPSDLDAPKNWPSIAVEAARKYRASYIFLEKNFGGDMAKALFGPLKPPCHVKAETVRGKKLHRAIPVHQQYQLEHVFHDRRFPLLEDQMLGWDPLAAAAVGRARLRKSPDRMDAMCLAVNELGLQVGPVRPAGGADLPSSLHDLDDDA